MPTPAPPSQPISPTPALSPRQVPGELRGRGNSGDAIQNCSEISKAFPELSPNESTGLVHNRVNAMFNDKIRPPDSFSPRKPPSDYPHVPMMLSIPHDPWEVLETIDESAANPTISDVDREIESLCMEYSTASEEQRVVLRRVATNGWSFLHYAHRMAIRAMRTNNPEWIHLGLISLLLENGRSDPRETITCLAMFCHAASYIKSDFALLAGEATEMATPGMASYINEFVGRDPNLQSLSMFGLRETQDANGPRINVDEFRGQHT